MLLLISNVCNLNEQKCKDDSLNKCFKDANMHESGVNTHSRSWFLNTHLIYYSGTSIIKQMSTPAKLLTSNLIPLKKRF